MRRTVLLAGLGLLAVALAACSPLAIVNRLTPSDTYTVTTDLAYGPEARDRLDLYRPRESADRPAPRGGYPVVVFFYGGSWNSGERVDYRFVGEALASHGIVTVVADYRLYPQVRYPDFLADCAQAVAWAKREAPRYGGDASRLFVMGHSSGGYNAAMLALDPRWLTAAGVVLTIFCRSKTKRRNRCFFIRTTRRARSRSLTHRMLRRALSSAPRLRTTSSTPSAIAGKWRTGYVRPARRSRSRSTPAPTTSPCSARWPGRCAASNRYWKTSRLLCVAMRRRPRVPATV